ncbi:MAG: TonB-dependent receptor [Pseudomonadales bacterium]
MDAVLTYDRIRDDSQTMPQDPRFNGDNPFENLANKREPTQYDVDQLGLRVDWSLNDNLTLHSITGWHDGHDKVNQDFDGGTVTGAAIPFAQLHTLRDQEFEVITQELRLTGAFSPTVDFMIGAYYLDADLDFSQRTTNILQLPPAAIVPGLSCAEIPGLRPNPGLGDALCQFANARSLQAAGEKAESIAFFGSLTWRPTAELEFTVGARYIDEEKKASNSYFDFSDRTFDDEQPGFSFDNEFDFLSLPSRAGVAYSVDDSWDDIIFTGSASWAYTDSNRAYVTYSEGFRSGGFSIRSARDPSEAAFDPEDAWQLEIGFKNEFLDRRLIANLSLFRLERDGAQFSSIIPLPPGAIPGTTTIINNGGKSQVQGVELETMWLINERLSLAVNGGFIDVDNKKFSLPCDVIDGCVTATPGVLDPSGTPREFGGNSDSRQPEWNYSVRLAYEQPLGPGILNANVGYKEVGEFLLVNTGGGANQRLFEGNYYGVDAGVAYEWALNGGDTLTISVFGKNLTDEEWKEHALFLGGPTTGFQGWGAPRTYAVEFTYNH